MGREILGSHWYCHVNGSNLAAKEHTVCYITSTLKSMVNADSVFSTAWNRLYRYATAADAPKGKDRGKPEGKEKGKGTPKGASKSQGKTKDAPGKGEKARLLFATS
eukprot:631106-Amphidinium_carterae.1